MRNEVTSKPTNRWRKLQKIAKICFGVLLLATVVAGFYLAFWQWLVIKNVRCVVAGQLLDEAVCLPNSNLRGKPLLFTKFDDSSVIAELQTVTTPNQLIYFTHVRKYLPNTLELHYAVSQPMYTLTFDKNIWYVVNSSAHLKQVSEKPNLPEVFWSQSFSAFDVTGGVVPLPTHQWLLHWLSAATDQQQSITYVGLDDKNQISLLFDTGRRVLITAVSDPLVELERLRLIEAEVTSNKRTNQKKLIEIDLRFRFPVLREK